MMMIPWPNAIYQWRKMSYVTNDDTLLPLPLELAKKVEDYARVIGPNTHQPKSGSQARGRMIRRGEGGGVDVGVALMGALGLFPCPSPLSKPPPHRVPPT